jgi:polyisoprenoid-binding protein YceI
MKRSTLCVALVLAGIPGPGRAAQSLTWSPDLIHSRAEFTVSHLVVSKVWGHIPIQAMTIATPAGSVIPSKIDATLNVAREDTDNHERDADLRSATYFDVEHYPTMAFHSTKIEAKGPDDFEVAGTLTIKDITKPVTFSGHVEGRVPDEGGGTRVGYSGELHIDRRDFGIVDNRLSAVGVLVVGYDVTIRLTAEAVTQDASVRVK